MRTQAFKSKDRAMSNDIPCEYESSLLPYDSDEDVRRIAIDPPTRCVASSKNLLKAFQARRAAKLTAPIKWIQLIAFIASASTSSAFEDMCSARKASSNKSTVAERLTWCRIVYQRNQSQQFHTDANEVDRNEWSPRVSPIICIKIQGIRKETDANSRYVPTI